MNEAQEFLLDLLADIRGFEEADEGDKVADAAAIKSVYETAESLTKLGYRKGADGQYRKEVEPCEAD